MRVKQLLIVTALLCCSSTAAAAERTIQIIGRQEVTVTAAMVRLSDVALVQSDKSADTEAVIALQKLEIARSPRAGASTALSAGEVLEALKRHGVDLDQVSYSLPRVVSLRRAARPLSEEEIRAAIEKHIAVSGRDMALKGIYIREPVQVLPGDVTLTVRSLKPTAIGRNDFQLAARVADEPESVFQVSAEVDEWREVPVVGRPLPRGAVVEPQDIMMARMNVNAIPRDALQDQRRILGQSTTGDFGYGDFFRAGRLSSPLAVEDGEIVTLLYRSRLFEASAKGTAMQSGSVGEAVRVRNDGSRKVVQGRVTAPGVVEVNQ